MSGRNQSQSQQQQQGRRGGVGGRGRGRGRGNKKKGNNNSKKNKKKQGDGGADDKEGQQQQSGDSFSDNNHNHNHNSNNSRSSTNNIVATTTSTSSSNNNNNNNRQQQRGGGNGRPGAGGGRGRGRNNNRRGGKQQQQQQQGKGGGDDSENANGKKKTLQEQQQSSTATASADNDEEMNKDNNNNRRGNNNNNNNNKKKKRNGTNRRSRRNNHNHNSNNENGEGDNDEIYDVPPYPSYLSLEECQQRYGSGDPTIVRGTLRVLSSSGDSSATASFVTCDRGLHQQDVCIPTNKQRNRALHGDRVYVELDEEEEVNDEKDNDEKEADGGEAVLVEEITEELEELGISEAVVVEEMEDDEEYEEEEDDMAITWQDDQIQVVLWNPIVPGIVRRSKKSSKKPSAAAESSTSNEYNASKRQQRHGRVVQVLPPRAIQSEIKGSATSNKVPNRPLVGTLKVLQSGTVLLNPNSTKSSLPQFKCRPADISDNIDKTGQLLYKAEYVFGSWDVQMKWPPCTKLQLLGDAFNIENEIQALLIENDVDHGEFSQDVLQCVQDSVESGLYNDDKSQEEQNWKPTPDMYEGRRDYRSQRIFTIDPTTAKDLDDALHISQLPNGQIEIGVHIADVSYFVTPNSPVNIEAQRRTTTVYLVDRTVPMLPRPLCEIACSLNEDVERLAFSCIWRMNPDGTLCKKKKMKKTSSSNDDDDDDDVWYGRTVIRSCARLDYSTAQNIIDGTVATGESLEDMDDELWPPSRRPTGGHTVEEVAADVRLMHRVAMARRKLRFDNGALALRGIKLAFQLDDDGQTPLLAQPYPIRASNRLVEEYMLLANYLVAQRLITHAQDLAVLRMHPEPLMEGLGNVVTLAKAAMDFDINPSTSQTLHESLVKLSQEANNDSLVIQCVTSLLMKPMQAAEYFVAGLLDCSEEWRHYALNIPYYTHFTSPIRRYPDVLVHRLLQATIDGPQALENFPFDQVTLGALCDHSNDKRMASKESQERCDRIFLSLYAQSNPIKNAMGVVFSVGRATFTVFIPSLGVSSLIYLQEHTDMLSYAPEELPDGTRRILLQQKHKNNSNVKLSSEAWDTLEITIMTKLLITVKCRDKPPVDIKLRLEGPYNNN